MTDLTEAPFKATSFIARDIAVERCADGTILMASRIPLELAQPNLPAYLRYRAQERPDALWISEPDRAAGTWRSITFAEARRAVDSLAQALLDLKVRKGGTLALLSSNSIEHAMMTYAAYLVGIPIVPVTPAYSLQSNAAAQLQERLSVADPALVFVQDAEAYARALGMVGEGVQVIAVDNADLAAGHLDYGALVATEPTAQVEEAFAAVDADAMARLMFTSGSSGSPKAVIHTQRNIMVAVESNLTAFGQKGGKGVTRLDWMPWSHVTGSAVLAATLISGGTFYVDDGKPVGADFARTLENLKHVSPTNYFSMPAGYVMLVDALEQDSELAGAFFANLLTMGYGGARMPDNVARRLQTLAVAHTGHKIPITCGYGSTETGPGGALVYWPTDRVGMIGLPHPGYDLKLVPLDEERYEVRVRSAAVTPGYLGLPEETANMLDEDGYFRMGDAAAFVDPTDPLAGLVFAGRISDEFKLVTGTFVRAGELHDMLMLATAPLVQHLVLCGEGEKFVAILAWLNLKAARELTGLPEASVEELNRHPQVIAQLSQALAAYNRDNPSSSRCVRRFCLLDEMPSSEAGELADKGSIRAGNVRRRRAKAVASLFADTPPAEVHTVGERA
ncbi:MAG: acyl-CoA synthetase [Sphingobium sp.]|nr:MAG: acyl-CoA synthetase [Sphingobium sp.]